MSDDAREARKRRLDDAVREYIESMRAEGKIPDGHFTTGWILGISMGGYEEAKEIDGLITESSPGINNFMASGLAQATGEEFSYQANPRWASDD
ncbi:hypothetical protein SEA_HUWBERT_66 [Microbacterium phage Huwbert]|nr:hypothetical protein SEA_HUWBERT_66 [Microbacterium phage Huwbert]